MISPQFSGRPKFYGFSGKLKFYNLTKKRSSDTFSLENKSFFFVLPLREFLRLGNWKTLEKSPIKQWRSSNPFICAPFTLSALNYWIYLNYWVTGKQLFYSSPSSFVSSSNVLNLKLNWINIKFQIKNENKNISTNKNGPIFKLKCLEQLGTGFSVDYFIDL